MAKTSVKLPISFEEVPYYNNEFRGDLIVTTGVLYFFPHTRVVANRYAAEIGGKDAAVLFGRIGMVVPGFGALAKIHTMMDKSVKFAKFIRRTTKPRINEPRMEFLRPYLSGSSCQKLQRLLDARITDSKFDSVSFEHDSVPRPQRFSIDDTTNLKLGWKLKFDARYDTHDFRVHPLQKEKLKKSLLIAGFTFDT